jgi:hypothetical protein
MGVIFNGKKIAGAILNGKRVNGKYNGVTMFNYNATPAGDVEEFLMTINTRQTNTSATGTTQTTFSVPVGNAYAYNWLVEWGDGTSGVFSGVGSKTNGEVNHTYAVGGTYQIRITPAGSTDAWFRAFGRNTDWDGSGGSAAANMNKIVSPDSVLTPLMFGTAAEVAAGVLGDGILYYTFRGANGIAFTMGANFGFSESWNAIHTAGYQFASSLFQGVTSPVFNMNAVFNLPQGLTGNQTYFIRLIFHGVNGAAFQVNDIFTLPPNTTDYTLTVGVDLIFDNLTAPQNRTAASIINGAPTPATARNAFSPAFPDYDTLPDNWKA